MAREREESEGWKFGGVEEQGRSLSQNLVNKLYNNIISLNEFYRLLIVFI